MCVYLLSLKQYTLVRIIYKKMGEEVGFEPRIFQLSLESYR